MASYQDYLNAPRAEPSYDDYLKAPVQQAQPQPAPVGEWSGTDVISPVQQGVAPEGVTFQPRIAYGNIPGNIADIVEGGKDLAWAAASDPVGIAKAIPGAVSAVGSELYNASGARGMVEAYTGGGGVVTPTTGQGELATYNAPVAEAIKADYIKNYGSLDGFYQHLMTDPVMVSMDAAAVYFGGLRPLAVGSKIKQAGVKSSEAAQQTYVRAGAEVDAGFNKLEKSADARIDKAIQTRDRVLLDETNEIAVGSKYTTDAELAQTVAEAERIRVLHDADFEVYTTKVKEFDAQIKEEMDIGAKKVLKGMRDEFTKTEGRRFREVSYKAQIETALRSENPAEVKILREGKKDYISGNVPAKDKVSKAVSGMSLATKIGAGIGASMGSSGGVGGAILGGITGAGIANTVVGTAKLGARAVAGSVKQLTKGGKTSTRAVGDSKNFRYIKNRALDDAIIKTQLIIDKLRSTKGELTEKGKVRDDKVAKLQLTNAELRVEQLKLKKQKKQQRAEEKAAKKAFDDSVKVEVAAELAAKRAAKTAGAGALKEEAKARVARNKAQGKMGAIASKMKRSDRELEADRYLDEQIEQAGIRAEILRKAEQVEEGFDADGRTEAKIRLDAVDDVDQRAIAMEHDLTGRPAYSSDELIKFVNDRDRPRNPRPPKQNRRVTDAKDRDPSLPPTTKLGVLSEKPMDFDRRHDVPVVGDVDPVNPSTKGVAAGKKAEVYESIIDDAYGAETKRKHLEKYGEFGLNDDGLKMSKEEFEWNEYQADLVKPKDLNKQWDMEVVRLQGAIARTHGGDHNKINRLTNQLRAAEKQSTSSEPVEFSHQQKEKVSWKQHQKDQLSAARSAADQDARIARGDYSQENIPEVVTNPVLEKMLGVKPHKAKTAKQTVKTQFVGAELNSAQREANTKHLVTVNKQINTEKKNLRNLKSRLITKETTQVDSDRLPPKEAGAWLKDRQKIRADEVKELKDKIKGLETERDNVPFKRTKQETPTVLTKTERKEAAAWLKDNITQTKTAKAELAAIKKKKLFTPKEITDLSTLSPGERAARKRQRQAWKDEDIKLVEEKIAWLENERKNPPYSDRLKPKNPDGKPLNIGGRDSEFAANKMMDQSMESFTGPRLTKEGLASKRRFDKVDFYDRKRAQEKLDRMSKTETKDLGLPSKDGLVVEDLTPAQFTKLLGKRKPINLGGRDSEFAANKMMHEGMESFVGPRLTKKGLEQKRRFDKVDFYDKKRVQEKLSRMTIGEIEDAGIPLMNGLVIEDLTVKQFAKLLKDSKKKDVKTLPKRLR